MSQEFDHERIRRLIQERMEQGKRPNGTYLPKAEWPPQHFNFRSVLSPINLATVQGGLGLLAFALFRQAFVEAMVEQRERDAGIVPGDPNTPVSWDGLEALLGKEQVERMRRGGTPNSKK